MTMIFPGMDPYLEDPQIWPGVHSALVVYLRRESPVVVVVLDDEDGPSLPADAGREWVEGQDHVSSTHVHGLWAS